MVTAKLYPSFLIQALSDDSKNFIPTGLNGEYNSPCQIALFKSEAGFLGMQSIVYNTADNTLGDIGSGGAIPLKSNEDNWTSVQSTNIIFKKSGNAIEFWINDITWIDVPDGEIFNRIIVFQSDSTSTFTDNKLIMYIELDSDHTVDGAFKLRKTSGGEVKITFS